MLIAILVGKPNIPLNGTTPNREGAVLAATDDKTRSVFH
jgi:hypothetical protein